MCPHQHCSSARHQFHLWYPGFVHYALTVPANNDRGPRYMEKALAEIHQATILAVPIEFAYGSCDGELTLQIGCHESHAAAVLQPITANYPAATLERIGAEEHRALTDRTTWHMDLMLHPEIFPILRHAQFEDSLNRTYADPISGLLRALRPDEFLVPRLSFFVQRASPALTRRASLAVQALDRSFFRDHPRLAAFYLRQYLRGRWHMLAALLGRMALRSEHASRLRLDSSTSREHEREDDLHAAADKVGNRLFDVQLRLSVTGPASRAAEAQQRLHSLFGSLAVFTRARMANFQQVPKTRFGRRPSFLLSPEELATLWHPPTVAAAPEKMRTSEFSELEAPAFIHAEADEGSVTLGRVCFRQDARSVVLALEDRRRHLYVVGKTGMGKSTLLQNMITADLAAGHGCCLVDPHGDLAETITGLVPSHRTNDVILFDAGSRDFVISFNPLACEDPSRVDQVTSGVVSAFKKINSSWGPRLEDTLRNAVFAVVQQGGNLMSVMRLLGEKAYRERVVPQIADDVVRGFWMHEFASWSENYRTEAVAAIQNKIRPFLTNTNIRSIVSQSGQSLNLRRIMDEGKVLIINLSKGRLGEDNSTLLGAFLVSSIQQAAMTRADVPEAQRRDFYLYVDEFQNFTTGSFASVLSEARKFRLSLIVAHQYLTQLDEETSNAIFGNVGSLVCFQVGSTDAQPLALQLSRYENQVAPESLTGLPKYHAYTRLLIDGMPSSPFSMRTMPPASVPDLERSAAIRKVTQRQFGSRLP